MKYISDMLVNFYYNYLEHSDPKKYDFKVDKGDNSIVIAKIDLYLCLNQINPKLYNNKINSFV
jgi:hypothetical protein